MMSDLHRVRAGEVNRFIEHLRSSDRRPMAVASIPDRSRAPSIDIGKVAEELGDSFDYWVLESEQTFEMTRALGSKEFSVHSGWLRLYPSGPAWQSDARLARNFPPDTRHPDRVLGRIVEHGLNLLFREGSAVSTSAATVTGKRRTAIVQGVVNATQFMVEVPGERGTSVASASAIIPGIAADRLLRPGMPIEGTVTGGGLLGSFHPEAISGDQTARVREFVGDGIATLALCTKVESERAALALIPGFEIELVGEEEGDLRRLLEPGDLAAIEVVYVDDKPVASLTDLNLEPAMSVLRDGPPWLVVPEEDLLVREEDGDESDDENDANKVEGSSTIDEREHENALQKIEHFERENEELRAKLRKALREAKASAKLDVPIVFDDPEEQLRFEVQLAWLEAIPNSQRGSELSLSDYLVGDDFIDSVNRLVRSGGIKRSRIVEVIAKVLCGQARTGGSITPKPWTNGAGGPQLTRLDGATAWRARLQVNTSSARRLKYWTLPNGAYELDNVTVHDEGIRKG